MASGYVTDMNGLSAPVDYTAQAIMQFGDNDSSGYAELLLGGNGSANYSSGQLTWNPDSETDGSWDSGWVPIELTVYPGGGTNGVQFAVQGASPGTLVDSNETYGNILAVELTADAQAEGSFQFSNVHITFSDASNATDTYTADSGPSVDDATGDAMEEQLLVTPSISNATKVQINAQVRMTSPNGPYLNVNDLFGRILIYTASNP